jgi:hypothetical protein
VETVEGKNKTVSEKYRAVDAAGYKTTNYKSIQAERSR